MFVGQECQCVQESYFVVKMFMYKVVDCIVIQQEKGYGGDVDRLFVYIVGQLENVQQYLVIDWWFFVVKFFV